MLAGKGCQSELGGGLEDIRGVLEGVGVCC